MQACQNSGRGLLKNDIGDAGFSTYFGGDVKSQFEGCSSVLLLMVAWMRETRAQNPRNYVEEANLVESIAGRMRTDDAYSLQSPLPVVQAEQSEDSIGVPMARPKGWPFEHCLPPLACWFPPNTQLPKADL